MKKESVAVSLGGICKFLEPKTKKLFLLDVCDFLKQTKKLFSLVGNDLYKVYCYSVILVNEK